MEEHRGARGSGASSSHRENGATRRGSGKGRQREGGRGPASSSPKPINPAFARLMQKLVNETDGEGEGESSGWMTYNREELLMVRDTMERPTCPSDLPSLLISSIELPLPKSAISTRRRSSSNVSNDSPQPSRPPPGPSRLNPQMAPSSATGGRQGDRGNRRGPPSSMQERGARDSTTRGGRERDRDRGRYGGDGFGERGGGGHGRREQDDLWDSPLADDVGLMPDALDMAARFEAERQSCHRGNAGVEKEGGEKEELKQAVAAAEAQTARPNAPPGLGAMDGAVGETKKAMGDALGKAAEEEAELSGLSSVGGIGQPRSVRDLSIDLDKLLVAGVLGQSGGDRAEQPVENGRGAGASLAESKLGMALGADPFRSALFSFAAPGEAHSTIDLYREMAMQRGATGDASGASAMSRPEAWASSVMTGMEANKGLGMAGASPWAQKPEVRPIDPWAHKPERSSTIAMHPANAFTTPQAILGLKAASSLPKAEGATTPAVSQDNGATINKGADLMSLLGFDKGAGRGSGTAAGDSTEATGRGEAAPVVAKPASQFAFRSTTSTARPHASAARPRPPPQPLHAAPVASPGMPPSGLPAPVVSTGAGSRTNASVLTAQHMNASQPTPQQVAATGGGHVMPPHYGPPAPQAYPYPFPQHVPHAQGPRQVVYAYVPPMPPPRPYHYHPNQHLQHPPMPSQYQYHPPRAHQQAAPRSGVVNGQGMSNGLAKLFGAGAAIQGGTSTTQAPPPDGKILSLAEIEQQQHRR